ncbi:hypothetical protein BDZ97DRAFT_1815335 [Flammula alnicola]|nr:hypothetical protein BDZ97DRAFT_1815335 [Flammula alnicola]
MTSESKSTSTNASEPGWRPSTALGRRIMRRLGDPQQACYFFALCGVWATIVLNSLIALLFLTKSAPRLDTICWCIATAFWGVVAGSIHYLKRKGKLSELTSNPSTTSVRAQLAESIILTVFMCWYNDAILGMNPYQVVFKACEPPWDPNVRRYYWGNPFNAALTIGQCDFADAILKILWVGPIALSFASWSIVFSSMSRASEKGEPLISGSVESREEAVVPGLKHEDVAETEKEELP